MGVNNKAPLEERLIERDIDDLYLLHGFLKDARARLNKGFRIAGLDEREDRAYWAKGLLIVTRKLIEADPIPGWRVKHLNDSLQLLNDSSGLTVRITKEYAFGGGLAPAGHNKARRAVYAQDTLREVGDFPITLSGQPTLDDVTMFITWALLRDGSFELLAQKPCGTGHFRQGAPVSLVIPVPTTRNELRFPAKSSSAPLHVDTTMTIDSEGREIVSGIQQTVENERV